MAAAHEAAPEEDPTQVELEAADGTGAKLDLVKMRTGEEGLECLFKEHAKAFRFDEGENEWKERGLGDVRFLRNPKTGDVQIVMRRDGVLKVCINMFLSDVGPLMPYPASEKAWVWTGMDYSEGDEATRETIALRFQSVEVAKQFKEHFERK
eukprot:TRINITY_DN2475_c0_g1_i1.p1 TRINITY_DN2475_c0_g1~~TRINITY_DN2475_c0_g1_i1.p1  ORF type:complete len:152 (+),score=58.87 TRINITY_DN2475_c0_g1_i1:67-522(+)